MRLPIHRVRNAVAALGAFALSAAPMALAKTRQPKAAPLAQRLVERIVKSHPNVHEAGIVADTAKGCFNIASTDRHDLGERCESDDAAPLRTGTASVGKEGGGYAVSMPLRDRDGNQVGALGIEFRRGQLTKDADALAEARSIASEIEPQIPSKSALLAR